MSLRSFSAVGRSLPLLFPVVMLLGPMAGAATPGRVAPVSEGEPRGSAARLLAPATLWDEAGSMSPGARGTVRARLEQAARRAGVPIAILVVGRRVAARESLDELARRTFGQRHLAAGGQDAVLLVAAPALGRSAIETGKGDAGIVPEIDARGITAELQRRLGRASTAPALARALGDAADAIATSILATEERRRPLPKEEDHADAIPAAAATPSLDRAGPSGASGLPGANEAPPAPPPPRRSILPSAVGLAVVLLIGLGLRQRRRRHQD